MISSRSDVPGNDEVTAAIQRAMRQAALEHARAGRSVPAWRNGKVVDISPADMLRMIAEADLVANSEATQGTAADDCTH